MIGKALPRASSLVPSLSLLDTLERGLTSLEPRHSRARVSIARAVAYLASHHTQRCADVLASVDWTQAEVNDLVTHVMTKLILTKDVDWWHFMLTRAQHTAIE